MTHSNLHRSRQRGVASIIIVAILFFVMAMVAAYTNRNLIFEQRTAGNQYRSTQAFEAAQAGVEWALAMLNTGRIDDSCEPSAEPTSSSFRERYLTINAINGIDGIVMPKPDATAGIPLTAAFEGTLWPSCVLEDGDWTCSCPDTGSPSLTEPADAAVHPAFRLRFRSVDGTAAPTQPSVVWMDVYGCTRLSDECLDFPGGALASEGRALVSVLVALRSGLAAVPAAALTVRGTVAGAPTLKAYNTDAASGGIAILAGGGGSGDYVNYVGGTVPGTPSDMAVVAGDSGLQSLDDYEDGLDPDSDHPLLQAVERMFSNTFAVGGDTYKAQPGAVVVDCAAGCAAAVIQAKAQQNPGRVLWANGNVNLDAGVTGAANAPVMLVVDGNMTMDAGAVFWGAIYVRDGSGVGSWTGGGTGGTINGAVIGDSNLVGTPAFSVVYNPAVLTHLRWNSGSFVRVPGGWKDF